MEGDDEVMNKDSSKKKDETKGLRSQPIIERWELRNFQSIKDFETLDLEPLTIFSGPNSSGKSAVIKSLLMVSQSLGSSAQEVPLVLNGKYTQLGDFDHILHHGSNPPEIELSFVIKRQKEKIDVWVKIKKDPKSLASMRVVGHTIKSWKESEPDSDKEFRLLQSPVKLHKNEIQEASQILQEQIKQRLFDYEIIEPKSIESHPQYEETISASLSNFLPGRQLVRVKPTIRNLIEEVEQVRAGIGTLIEIEPDIHVDWDRELSKAIQATFALIPTDKFSNHERNILKHIVDSETPWTGLDPFLWVPYQ